MPKKATTILLVIVVLFLLASTVYISIILTADPESQATTPSNTRASEIEEKTVPVADDSITTDPLTAAETSLELSTDGEPTDPLASQSSEAPADSEEITDPESDLLAYANPSPTGAAPTGKSGLAAPTTAKASGTPTPADAVTEDLPGTGTGQTKVSPTKAISPTPTPVLITQSVQQTQQQLPQSLPVAGSIGGPLLAFLVAGGTIVAAFFL